jgi:hypothetical protein
MNSHTQTLVLIINNAGFTFRSHYYSTGEWMGDVEKPVTALWLSEKHFSLPRIESSSSAPSAVIQTDELTAK